MIPYIFVIYVGSKGSHCTMGAGFIWGPKGSHCVMDDRFMWGPKGPHCIVCVECYISNLHGLLNRNVCNFIKFQIQLDNKKGSTFL